MAYVWFGIVGIGYRHRIPYATRGLVVRRGPKRTVVDFDGLGRWRVPNAWLRDTRPDPEQMARMRAMAGAFGGDFGREIIKLAREETPHA